MDIGRWLNNFGNRVATADLKSPAATALVAFVERHAGHIATLVEARRGQGRELVVLDFQTGRPQKSAYPIKRVERIGVRFTDDEAMPTVYMLRPDFPDTAHQQLVIEGFPRAICLDDRPWGEARLTWTPAELVERTLSWFARAGRGDLHDARQPLDPVLFGTPLSFIIARDVLRCASKLDLVGIHDVDRHQILRVRPVQPSDDLTDHIEPICLVAYSIPPERMQRLQFAPETLGSLADMLADRGIDLFADLRVRFSDWVDRAEQMPWRVLSRFAVIVEMSIIAPDGSHQDGTDLRAFLTNQRVGEIAEALGVALKSNRSDQGSRVGYVKAVISKPEDTETLRAITAQSAEVHYEFDRYLATQLSGRTNLDERHVVMVGAGAIGSHVADCLGREGRFRWTIIDGDRLLPHNIARHIGRDGDVTKAKADLVAASVSGTIHNFEPIARAISANVLPGGASRDDIDQELEKAEIVLDATASVLAARFLSDHPTGARRSSVFFNPSGDAVVLLAEPADRSQTLRDLEAQYLGLVACDERLAGHFSAGDETYAYTGACRAITNLIPESRVMTLSGLVSDGLSRAVDQDDAVIKIWSLHESGAVEIFEGAPAPVETFSAEDWNVSIDNDLIARIQTIRAEHLPQETGGILTGVVDIPAKRIHVVDAALAPADSKGSDTGFVRGTANVQKHLDRISEQTRGQVRYVGEWHSHPPRAETRPSPTDLAQIDWLATLFEMDNLPALMLIAGDKDIRIIFANCEAELVEPVDDRRHAKTSGRQA